MPHGRAGWRWLPRKSTIASLSFFACPLLERVRPLLFLVPEATQKRRHPLALRQRPAAPSVDSLLHTESDISLILFLVCGRCQVFSSFFFSYLLE